jgi:hypothetical protein
MIMNKYGFLTAAFAAIVHAQTYSACNPLKQSKFPPYANVTSMLNATSAGCPPKPGFNSASPIVIDFTQGANPAFATTNGNVTYNSKGANFVINSLTDAPTLASNDLLFFGYVEATLQAAPGQGIVSSFILESDDLDEIDWEIIGSQTTQAQSNYFGKGNTTTYDRGQLHAVNMPQTETHTYAVDWRPGNTTWLIDGKVVRTLLFADAVGGANYPQTPMNVRLGNWVAGNPANAPGTVQWAGGLTNVAQAPFTFTVKSVKIINYFPAVAYSYSDNSGSWQSIKLWNTSSTSSQQSTSSASLTASGSQVAAESPAATGTTVTIKAGSTATGAASNGGGGIVAAGSVNATTLPVYTILVGGSTSSGAAGATNTATAAGQAPTTQVSSPLNGTSTTTGAVAKQTTSAGVRNDNLSKLALVAALFVGLAMAVF